MRSDPWINALQDAYALDLETLVSATSSANIYHPICDKLQVLKFYAISSFGLHLRVLQVRYTNNPTLPLLAGPPIVFYGLLHKDSCSVLSIPVYQHPKAVRHCTVFPV
jgi:hypothetical protein